MARRFTGPKLVVATHNRGKAGEIRSLLGPMGVEILQVTGRSSHKWTVSGVGLNIKASRQTIQLQQQMATIFHDQALHQGFEEACVAAVVRFGNPDQFTAGQFQPPLPLAEGRAGVLRVQQQAGGAGVLFGEALQDRGAAIAGGVVEQDQLQMGIGLAGDAGQAFREKGSVVVAGHDHAHQGRLPWCLAKSESPQTSDVKIIGSSDRVGSCLSSEIKVIPQD